MNDLSDVELSSPSAKIAKESVVQAIAGERWLKVANWKAEVKSAVHRHLSRNVDLYTDGRDTQEEGYITSGSITHPLVWLVKYIRESSL
jgi:CRISPR/Cas system-associated protein Cas10 (large subunit of type III CRISPR-Cas system)